MSGAQNLNIPYWDVTDYRLLCGNCSREARRLHYLTKKHALFHLIRNF